MLHQHVAFLADGSTILGFDVMALIIVVFILAYAAFIVGAFVSILFADLNGGMKLVWLIFALCAPFIGSLCWFFIGRKNQTSRSA